MFRRRPSKGYMKQESAASCSRRPSRIIHLPYYETLEVGEEASFDEELVSNAPQSIFEDQTVAQEPLFHEPFIWELPKPEPDDFEEEEEEEVGEEGYENYDEESEDDSDEEVEEEEEEEEEEDEDEDSSIIAAAVAVAIAPQLRFDLSWEFPALKEDDMLEHYLSSDDHISIYSIHEPTVARAMPIFTYAKPRLIDIPPLAGRKRKAQYDTARQHSRNQSNSSDNSSQCSSNESGSHSDNESNGSWESPASSLATTPTTMTPVSPSGSFPRRSRTNPHARAASGTFPPDKLSEKYVADDAPSKKPFRRSVTRSGASSRPTSLMIPAYVGDDDDIDAMLEKADKATRRREWQSSSSVWHR